MTWVANSAHVLVIQLQQVPSIAFIVLSNLSMVEFIREMAKLSDRSRFSFLPMLAAVSKERKNGENANKYGNFKDNFLKVSLGCVIIFGKSCVH